MRTLGNLVWLIFGGIVIALEYFICSIFLMITIIGIPFGLQTLKLGLVALWPFGKYTIVRENSSGCLGTIMNIIWIFVGGIWISLSHVCFGILLSQPLKTY